MVCFSMRLKNDVRFGGKLCCMIGCKFYVLVGKFEYCKVKLSGVCV